MSKYYKAEDVINKYAEMIASDAYWEHGVGNGKPDEEDMEIARDYYDYADIPTIDIVTCKECVFAEYIPKYDDYMCCGNGSGLEHNGDWFCADGERIDNEQESENKCHRHGIRLEDGTPIYECIGCGEQDCEGKG